MNFRVLTLLPLLACSAQAQEQPLDDPSPEANAAEREAKQSWPVPDDWEGREVDWAATQQGKRLDPASLPAEAQATLPRVKVPVLLPSDAERLKTLMLLGDETWYAATTSADKLDVYIRGTLMARPMDWTAIDKRQMGPPETPWITRTHGIVSVMFSAYGVAYNLEIECMDGDPRCETDDLPWAIYESLAMAGGTP